MKEQEIGTSVARRARRSRRGGPELPVRLDGGRRSPASLGACRVLFARWPVEPSGRQDAAGRDLCDVGATREGSI